MPALGHEQIRRLDIAVNNASGVRRIERVGDLDAERQDRLHLHRAPRDQVFQRRAVEELHHEESLSPVLADVVDRADVRMIQRRCRLGLAPEALESLSVLRQILRQKLERDEAPQPGVLSLVDDTHPPAAELLDDPVM